MKTALLKKLAERGLDDPLWRDKVDEYMAFWVMRNQLRDDVAARGMVVTDERGRVSENRSVSLSIQVSRQMLAILQLAGLDLDPPSGDWDDPTDGGAFEDDL